MKIVRDFLLHNDRGQAVHARDLLAWRDPVTGSSYFGPLTRFSWTSDGGAVNVASQGRWIRVLPDKSGLICFESERVPDNCLLLDADGNERMRLKVPWVMTGSFNPASGDTPTAFVDVSDPLTHPKTGVPGSFGVTAWVELAGRYYFELDYQTGEFLWCRQIRD